MTAIQQRATALAREVCEGVRHPDALSDEDWELLLTASGTTGATDRSQCQRIATAVLNCLSAATGYFAEPAEPDDSPFVFRDGNPQLRRSPS